MTEAAHQAQLAAEAEARRREQEAARQERDREMAEARAAEGPKSTRGVARGRGLPRGRGESNSTAHIILTSQGQRREVPAYQECKLEQRLGSGNHRLASEERTPTCGQVATVLLLSSVRRDAHLLSTVLRKGRAVSTVKLRLITERVL